jgi:translation initiation factor IF-2
VGEEKRKEKEALRLERERELEEKRKVEDERNQVIKAKASISGPKKVGTIDLDSDKKEVPSEAVQAPKIIKEVPPPVKAPVAEAKKAPEMPKTPSEAKATTPTKKVVAPKVVAAPKPVKSKKETPPKEVVKKDDKPVVPSNAVEEKATPVVQKQESDAPKQPGDEKVATKYQKLSGPKITGQKIDLSKFNKPKKKDTSKDNKPGNNNNQKRKRKRIVSNNGGTNTNNRGGASPGNRGGANPGNRGGNFNSRAGGNNRGPHKGRRPAVVKEEPSEEEVQKQVRETLEKLQGKSSKNRGAKNRRDKRDQHRQKRQEEQDALQAQSKTLKVTEFVTVAEVATMMNVSSTGVIGTCMSLGIMVTQNQRLDAETLSIVADEFGYEVEFITADIEEAIQVEEDDVEDLTSRAPIVTVMGHVDHGKTSLLDYVRKENVIAGESGGITQHIGAYGVTLESGQKIAFLDTPGHEAFTAMRARGAQVTDLAIIVIAADDDIMPQTKEAISHAQAAGVPIVFAINKIDKPTANPEKIKERLAAMNLLVEDWGGKIQSHDISAKTGLGVPELLEKVLLEAELLELKANPDKDALGTVVEAFLDKGRGYVSTILVQAGTLKIGDYVLVGKHSGKVRAMHDERGNSVAAAGPSTPVSILGLDGAPQAGDKFNVFTDEREAKQIAARRTQLQREQDVRTLRRVSLSDIGRRLALGTFKELNVILKGDVDGSVEALTDSFQKLSTEEIEVKIILKGVGAITESDVNLASASDAVIIGFNVRPTGNAKQMADKEEIDIRTYSIIYDAINDLKDAMEGMLSPELKEEITGNAEIRETFKISKVGTIAGCMVTSGKIIRNAGVRLIRDGVVVYTGGLSSLKRFKDDAKEVSKGYDCGLQIKNYNDIKEGDIVESFQEVEVKKKLK